MYSYMHCMCWCSKVNLILYIIFIYYNYIDTKSDINITNVFRATLSIAAEWHNIGTLLNIPDGTLNTIKHDEGGSGANSCLRVMLTEWLKKTDPSPTWSELADAVEPFNESRANEIRTRFDK